MTLQLLTASDSLERLSHATTGDAVWVLVDRPDNLNKARMDVANLVARGQTEGLIVGDAAWATSDIYTMSRVSLPDDWNAEGSFKHYDLVGLMAEC